ncbi:MAG: hypothetical protein B7733_19075 [Myxococcales bacterium FL481]|nr:MAG: hypothetical protein B7733_19075 [Myxococcales bacterium FL481]
MSRSLGVIQQCGALLLIGALVSLTCKRGQSARSLEDQLNLLPEGTEDFLVVRDLAPVFEMLRAVKHGAVVLQRDGADVLEFVSSQDPNLTHADDVRRGAERTAAGVDAILTSGIEPGKGLVAGSTGSSSFLLVGAKDLEPLKRLATAIGEDPAEVDRICRQLAAPSGWVGCFREGDLMANYQPANRGKERLTELTQSGPVVKGDLVAARFPVSGRMQTTGVSFDAKAWHLRSNGAAVNSLDFLAPAPASALRDAFPDSLTLWANFSRDGVNQRLAPHVPAMAQALFNSVTGEVSFSSTSDKSLALRLGVSNPAPFEGLLLMGIPLLSPRVQDPAVLAALRLSSIDLQAATVQAGDRSVTVAHATVTSPTATDSMAMGIKPELTVFAGGGYVTAEWGAGLAAVESHVENTSTGANGAWLRTVPPTLAADLEANRVSMLTHLTLERWANVELPETTAQTPEARHAQEQALKVWRSAFAPFGPLSVWLSHDESQATAHLVLPMRKYDRVSED